MVDKAVSHDLESKLAPLRHGRRGDFILDAAPHLAPVANTRESRLSAEWGLCGFDEGVGSRYNHKILIVSRLRG